MSIIIAVFLSLKIIAAPITTASATPDVSNPSHFCPLASELMHDGMYWRSKDNSWKCYTPSFTSIINSFTGAQWEGVNVGKIFCMYIGAEENAFPIALEQVHSDIVLEPHGQSWSATISGGYKICKSANVIDCPFHFQPPHDLSHIYDEIEYMGGTHYHE